MSKSLEFIGTCITTVDDLDFWDATEMAQCIDNSTPMNVLELADLLDNKELSTKIKANPENFEAGSNQSIAWIYDSDEDLHYFYYMHVSESRIKTFVEFNESLSYPLSESVELTQLVHTTTPEVADKIKLEGFAPVGRIDYKKYSGLGRDGCYFYPMHNRRMIQAYAYFMNQNLGKSYGSPVTLIYCEAHPSIVTVGESEEFGLFVKTSNLDKVKIKRMVTIKVGDIY